MSSSTLGGTVNGIARGHVLPPVWEGRVSKVLTDRLEVAVRSLNGDVQTLAARGWHPQIEDTDDGPVMILPKRGDRAWVGDDEGRALVVVTWQRIGESPGTALNTDPSPVAAVLAQPGDVKWTARTTAPDGWLACNGAVLNPEDEPDLFDAIGTTYGGNGVTTFNLPDLRGRVPVATGSGTGLTARTAGQTGGAETHALTTAEMPQHRHTLVKGTITALDDTATAIGAGGTTRNDAGLNVNNTGGGAAHQNMQPWLALLAVIKT